MTLLLLALKITVVFGLAGLTSMALRRARAAARHYVWGLALTAALVLPAVTLIGPRVALPVLPADIASVAVPAGAVVPDAIAQESAAAAAVAAPRVSPAPSRTGTAAAGATVPWLAMLWGGGAAAILALIGVSLLATVRLGRRGRPVVAGTMAEELEDARARLGIRRPVRLLLGDARAMPMTWGSVRPVVLLPAAAAEWSRARRRDVLLHELAHVRRFDWLSQIGARVVCAVYWWHPLAWYAARRLREERELACDDLVLAHGARAEDYAHHLLEIARGLKASRRTALAGVAMARPSQLAGRLLAVLDGSRQRAGLTRGHAGTAAVVAAAILLPVAGLTAVAAGPDKAADKTKPNRTDVAWTPPAPQAVPVVRAEAPRLTLCNWSDLGDARSSHSNIDDDRVTITIIVDRCELSVRSRGLVRFTDDERDVAELGMDSWFEIEERAADGTRRRAEFDRRTGPLARRWYVDGREQPWDAAAATWFQGALQVAFRRTSFQARERAARIYQRGGGQALLTEVERLYSSSAIMAYLELYADQETLTSDEARRIARLARARITSSSNLSSVLRTLLRNPGINDAARADIIEASGGISSSSARAEVLVAASEYAPLTPALADAVLQSSEGISSSSARGRVLSYVGTRLPADQPLPSSYVSAARGISSSSVQAEVLVALLERDGVTTAQLNAVLEIAGAIGSSSARARVLKTFLGRNGLGPATRPPFFRALNAISSSAERGEILRALTGTSPDAATVGDMLDATGNISSTSEQAEVLVAVARANLLTTDALRNQYLRVANSISSRSARERALRAVGAI